MEEWRDIENYKGKYMISSYGRVKSLNYNNTGKEKILKQITDKDGYKYVRLSKNNKTKNERIHRLVAFNFLPNIGNCQQVNHIDGKKNNNRIENLEWVTPKENIIHAYRIGLKRGMKGKQHPMYGKHHSDEAKKKISNAEKGIKNSNARAIVCKNNSKVFGTITEAREWANLKSNSGITLCCKGKQKTAGKDPVTKEPLQWKYYKGDE